MTESHQDAYDRGEQAGAVSAEIKEHGRRLDKINGSIEHTAGELHGLRQEVHAVKAILAGNEVTAAVVKDVDRERRNEVETKWARIVRLAALFGWLVAACLAVALIVMH